MLTVKIRVCFFLFFLTYERFLNKVKIYSKFNVLTNAYMQLFLYLSLIGLLVALFYGVSTLFGSFKAELNF